MSSRRREINSFCSGVVCIQHIALVVAPFTPVSSCVWETEKEQDMSRPSLGLFLAQCQERDSSSLNDYFQCVIDVRVPTFVFRLWEIVTPCLWLRDKITVQPRETPEHRKYREKFKPEQNEDSLEHEFHELTTNCLENDLESNTICQQSQVHNENQYFPRSKRSNCQNCTAKG